MKASSCGSEGCPADCPGRRSPWHAALSDGFPCPLGTPFCGCWNPDIVARKIKRNIVDRKEIAA